MIDACRRFCRRSRSSSGAVGPPTSAEEMRLHVELRAAAHRRHGLDDRDAALAATPPVRQRAQTA